MYRQWWNDVYDHCTTVRGLFADIVSFPMGQERVILLNDEMAPERPTCVLPPLLQAGPTPCVTAPRTYAPAAGGPIPDSGGSKLSVGT
jgi:hypothetical protein